MITIKGDYLEGGGQIVRTALALSALTGKAFEVSDIRKGRRDSGLKNQHLYCVKALQQLYNADVEGDELGSEYLKFVPGKMRARNLKIDVETAGSITLLLQSLLVPCFFADKKIKLEIIGGTDTKWSMPVDYFKEILVPQLNRFCEKIEVRVDKRGYFPKGQGNVLIEVKPKFKLSEFDSFNEFLSGLKGNEINLTEQYELIQVKGVSHASSDLEGANVADRQGRAAGLILNKLGSHVDIRAEYRETMSAGSGVVLWAIFSKDKEEIDFRNPIRIGADSLGEKGKKSEVVGTEASERLIEEIGFKAPVDQYLADNLIPWLGLFKGKMKVSKITNHTLTNIYVVEEFLGKVFDVDKENNVISVE